MSRLRHLPLLALLALPLAACSRSAGNPDGPDPADASGTVDPTAAQIGAPLYARAEYPAPAEGDVHADPVVVPASHLTVIRKQEVPSRLDGYVLFVGTELKEGQTVPPGYEVFTHPRTGVKYRQLKPGDPVRAGQVVVLMDDTLANAEVVRLDALLRGAKADAKGAEEALPNYRRLEEISKELNKSRSIADFEALQIAARVVQAAAEALTKQAKVQETEGELAKARETLALHTLRAMIDGEVAEVYRQPGEGIKATENILRIENHDKLRVQGYVPREDVGRLQVGMEAVVEPSMVQGPFVSYIAHRQPVTALAAGRRNAEPVVLTAGEDRSVKLFSAKGPLKSWDHPVVVRALACTGPGAAVNLALTGSDDGKARLWDLADLSDRPLRELDAAHRGAILAAAFSPDGRTCATADDRFTIILSDTATGKKLYQFPPAHRGPITAVHFTPQGRLVSVGRDNTIRVWELGKEGARLERTIEHRAGEVNHLGVSPDGARVLFDRSKSEMHVLRLPGGGTEQVIENPADAPDAPKFGTFATFSPDGRLVLAAINQDGALQLWRLPEQAQGHTSELRRLVCPDHDRPTAGVFVPSAQGGFIVVGTDSGRLHLWPTPGEKEREHRFAARLTWIDPTVDPTGAQVRVWAELDNPAGSRLSPGTPATLVIFPTAPGIASSN